MNLRFLADLGERAARSFIQGFLGLWLANPSEPVEFDTLFTLSNLKAGIVMAVLSIGMAVAGKGVGNPDTASVLPAPVAPASPPQPADVVLGGTPERLEEMLRRTRANPPGRA